MGRVRRQSDSPGVSRLLASCLRHCSATKSPAPDTRGPRTSTLVTAPRPDDRACRCTDARNLNRRIISLEESDHGPRPSRDGPMLRTYCQRGAGFALGPSWLGHRSPLAGPARDAGTGTAHCPLSGSAGNSGTTDDRSPNAGTIPIKPPAQRRMGVKRRLVDQGARTHPCVSTVLLLHDTAHLRHRYRGNSTGNGFGCSVGDARCQEFEPSNHPEELTAKNLLPPGRGPMLRDGPALAIVEPYRMAGPARSATPKAPCGELRYPT